MHYIRQPRSQSFLIGFIGVLFLALCWPGLVGSAHAESSPTESSPGDVDVIGDDEIDAFVGSGSLILPGRISTPGRRAAADCPGCSWRAVLTCDRTTPTACRGEARTCAYDSQWLTIYLTGPGGLEQWLGSDCFGPGGPKSRQLVENRVNEKLQEAVPPLRPAMSPPSGALVFLPIRFTSGQSATPMSWQWLLADMDIAVSATPTWQWRFASDTELATRDPGSLSEAGRVEHIYTSAGRRTVQMASTWRAQYWAEGLGPLTVQTPVRQTDELQVNVGQGRAVLVR